jgi:hypothetical protein
VQLHRKHIVHYPAKLHCPWCPALAAPTPKILVATHAEKIMREYECPNKHIFFIEEIEYELPDLQGNAVHSE